MEFNSGFKGLMHGSNFKKNGTAFCPRPLRRETTFNIFYNLTIFKDARACTAKFHFSAYNYFGPPLSPTRFHTFQRVTPRNFFSTAITVNR